MKKNGNEVSQRKNAAEAQVPKSRTAEYNREQQKKWYATHRDEKIIMSARVQYAPYIDETTMDMICKLYDNDSTMVRHAFKMKKAENQLRRMSPERAMSVITPIF